MEPLFINATSSYSFIIIQNMFNCVELTFSAEFISIMCFIIVFSLVNFYLGDFLLSDKNIIKCLQIFSVFYLLICTLYFYYNLENYLKSFNLIVHVSDKSNSGSETVSISGNINIGKEAGYEINNGISSLGHNIGLAATVGGVSAAVGKGIAKSSLPLFKKQG